MVDERRHDDDGDRQESHHEQLPRGDRKHHPHDDDVEQRLPDVREADIEQPLELVDVVVDRRQGAAGRPPLVPPEVEVLRVGVGVQAQVVLDRLGEATEEHGSHVLARRLDDPHDGIDHGEPHELGVARLHPQHPGHERVGAAHHHVDRRTDEQLRHDVGELVDARDRDREHESPAISAVARPEGGERPGGEGGRGVHGGPCVRGWSSEG